MQTKYRELVAIIPPGQSALVKEWEAFGLFYTPTDQICPQCGFDQPLQVGTTIQLGLQNWEIHAAGGNDPHAVVFFEPVSRILISADATWQNGFCVMFPELEGIDAFNEVAATLDLIECLNPDVVVPGHGAVFKYQREILAVARQKLDHFIRDPVKPARHGAKVLLKFKLLEKRKLLFSEFLKWAANTFYLVEYHHRFFAGSEFSV